MSTVTKSFAAAGLSAVLTLPPGQSASYALSGTFSANLYIERSDNGGATFERAITALIAAGSGTIKNEGKSDIQLRWRCFSRASGTAVCTIVDSYLSSAKHIFSAAGHAKAGTTSGWIVAVGDNIALVTCPASKTGSTLVVPIPRLKVGDTITGFHLIGQIESAGGAVTVDAELRKMTAAAADVADASVGAVTQLAVTADTIMSATNTRKTDLSEVVGEDETFYLLITATTAAVTDIALQGVAIEIKEG